MRMIQIQDNISEQKNLKDKLESEQEKLHVEYNKVSEETRRSSSPSSTASPSETQRAPFCFPLTARKSFVSWLRGGGGGWK